MTPETPDLDDLELELRRLPGVRSAGFDRREDVLLVQLQVGGERSSSLALRATQIATRYSEQPVAVEIVRWRQPAPGPNGSSPKAGAQAGPAPAPEKQLDLEAEAAREPTEPAVSDVRRVRLLTVLQFPETDEIEVHLALADRRTIGRSAASRGLLGAVEATLDALGVFAGEVPFGPAWTRTLETTGDRHVLVAVALEGSEPGQTRYGIAIAEQGPDAAARATLHALNRSVTPLLEPPS